MTQTQLRAKTEGKHTRLEKADKLYTVGEEVFNSVTHGVGALLSIIGGSVIVTLAVVLGKPSDVAAIAIYAISLVILYTMSTLYHAFPFPRVKKLFRIFDHSSVFLLIAGSYTPLMLITLRGEMRGIVIFIVEWSVTLIGILLNALWLNRFSKFSLVLYVIMGWALVFAIPQIIANMEKIGLLLLLVGGICYMVGIAFYVVKKVRYFHSVWHIFVVAGSILHYFCIAGYVLE
jgi:hemolysin III